MGKNEGLGARALVVLLALALAVLFTAQTGEAQVQKGKTRTAETKYLMRGINQPNCAGIANALKDKGPADDKAWDQVAGNASVLNEMSYVLMDDGRCPDKTWADAAKSLRDSSAKVLEAAKAKDLTAANASFKDVTAACASCHMAHRKKN
jgi:cytochrome c556